MTIRDESLTGLLQVLNSNENRHIFENWDANQLTDNVKEFFRLLESWTVGETAEPINLDSDTFDLSSIQCNDIKYSNVLTGNKLEKPRMIIDFVPFGYDTDKLLARFHESYGIVDIHVIYEQTYSLQGFPKPLYVPKLMKSPQFQKFSDRILYVTSDEFEILKKIQEVQDALSMQIQSKSKKRSKASFAVYFFILEDMIRKFKAIDPTKHPLKQQFIDNFYNKSNAQILGLQNDGDEIITKKTLSHLKFCEIRPNIPSIYAPCFSFKNNLYWVQRTYDMNCLSSNDVTDIDLKRELNQFIWRDGPHIWPIDTMLNNNHVLRYNYSKNFCQHHMGYGAAIHLSAILDPVEVWMKSCGTVENQEICEDVLTKEIILAGKVGQITKDMIFKATLHPWCHKLNYCKHIDTLSLGARRYINDSIPWVFKSNQRSFPFIFPERGDSILSKTTDPKWEAQECASVSSTYHQNFFLEFNSIVVVILGIVMTIIVFYRIRKQKI